jgi:hypothetical protein
MPKIFISHSWNDNEISRKLAQYLKRDGADIWIDYARIEGGDKLPKRIGNALKWCDALLLLWSQAAADSYWVEEEWTNALALRKRIIPCILDKVELPPILSNRLYIDIQEFDQGYQELYRTLKLGIAPIQQESAAARLNVLKPIFRSQTKALSGDEAIAMVKKHDFFDSDLNADGHGIAHQFEEKNISGDKIVLDHACGLMWQEGGSQNEMSYKATKKWIQNLNQKGFAGYTNWRLPTLEEAMSLMEPEEKNGDLFIDPAFAKKQRWIWTADQVKGNSWAWLVSFCDGRFLSLPLDDCYVRAVRSGQSSNF